MNMRLKTGVVIVGLTILAAIFRLYEFVPSVEFLGDQGRDALIAKRILIDHDPTLLGPPTSVGSMYLGPLYYYMMVPALALTYPSPVGPALMIAILGILTVPLIYILGKRTIGPVGALVAALLYTSAPVVVKLSRFSWQPNIAPFFGLLLVWCIYKGWSGWRWGWFWAVVVFAILIQSHYVALLAIGVLGLGYLIYLFDGNGSTKKDEINKLSLKQKFISSLIPLILGFLVLVISTTPLVIFDIRHDGLIRSGFAQYLQERSERPSVPVQTRLVKTWQESHGVGMRLTTELFGASKETRALNTYTLVALSLLTVLALISRIRTSHHSRNMLVLLVGSVYGVIVALSVYQDQVYDHYFAFLFPLVFLWIGALTQYVGEFHKSMRVVIFILAGLLMFSHVSMSPYWGARQSGIRDVEALSSLITEKLIESGNHIDCHRCNVAGLNDEKEYRAYKHRYFLEAQGLPLLSEYEYENLNILIVIVENKEDPREAPIFEIQQFMSENSGTVEMFTTSEIEYDHGIKAYIFEKELDQEL